MKVDFQKSGKMEFRTFEIEICNAWLKVRKDAMVILQDKKFQHFFIECPNNWNGSNRQFVSTVYMTVKLKMPCQSMVKIAFEINIWKYKLPNPHKLSFINKS